MSILQLIGLLVQLGPQFATVWKLIVQFIQQHQNPVPTPGKMTLEYADGRHIAFLGFAPPLQAISPETDAFGKLAVMHAMNAGVDAPGFNWQILWQIWQYMQAHPEVMAAIQAIIQAFLHPQPAPVIQPVPPVPPVNPFAK